MSSENTASDSVLADKLRRENHEQFHTLVRMHLSFVLDLHTDDNESASEKAKFKKWSLFPKKPKPYSRGVMEGAPLTQEGICQVYQLIEYLSKEPNISQEGIFRRTGSLSRQQELRALLNTGASLDLAAGRYSVHDCASVLKGFLAELPEPLLTDMHYPAYCQISELCGGTNKSTTNESRLLHSLQLLLLLLPPENRILLKDVLELLHCVTLHENTNKMSSDSLATLFTPHLLCPRKLSPEALHVNSQTMSGIVSFMITKGEKLFEIPLKLATDIRAYFLEREKKKILSPTKELNESISDNTAVNTVFSFIDRERTAQAHTTNPTEAALAQLYAHIQSLPESSKKRKLIKQFNKENGQGTPLQIQKLQKKELRPKSLGDSIKKHIFQKNLSKNMRKNVTLMNPMSSNIAMVRAGEDEEKLNTRNNLQHASVSLNVVPTNTSEKQTTCDVSAELDLAEPLDKSCDNNTKAHTPDASDRLWDVYASTPSEHILARCIGNQTGLFTPQTGRKSMSPITRSARRMSKAMQETMMTPRSRKPVLLISNTNIRQLAPVNSNIKESKSFRQIQEESSDDIKLKTEEEPNKTILNVTPQVSKEITNDSSFEEISQDDLSTDSSDNTNLEYMKLEEQLDDSSFKENSIDDLSNDEKSTEIVKKAFVKSKSEGDVDLQKKKNDPRLNLTDTPDSLSHTFREYLFNRSILTTSIGDESFSSRADDFNSHDLSKNTMSDSLLFCLDGNTPKSADNSETEINNSELSPNRKRSCKTSKEKQLTLKVRKINDSGDVVFESSL